MVVRIGSNISSLKAQSTLARTSDALSTSFERLSSGMRINRASDDAAGLAIASSLRADSRIYSQGIRNLNDGISALSIGEGALRQLSSVVTRQLELAEQAANGVYGSSQRLALHTEVNELVKEFNRIVASTQFNGRNLLDRSYLDTVLQAGSGEGATLSVGIGSQFGRAIGTGTFKGASAFNFGQDVDEVELADFNGDGILDMVTSSTNVSVALGNGDGTFRAAISSGSAAMGESDNTVFGDFNGDGYLDVGTRDFTNGSITTYLGNGNGTFRDGVSFDDADNEATFYVADFNNDGRDDLLINNTSSGNNTVRLANSDGSFGAGLVVNAAFGVGGSVADFNGDGILDIVLNRTGANQAVIFTGNGNGTFNASLTITSASQGGYGLGVADFNGDGKADFAIGDQGGTNINIFLGNGDGTFKAKQTFNIGRTIGVSDLIIGDINNDGYDDIFIGGSSAGNGMASTVFSNGDGTFSAALSFNTGISRLTPFLGDVNGDGVLDIVSQSAGGVDNNAQIIIAQTTLTSNQQRFDLRSQEDSLVALTLLRSELSRITNELGAIGAHQSRLGVAIKNLAIGRENIIAAESRIMDADIAEESAQNVRLRILQQVGASILSQANIQPQIALKLLEN